MLSLKEVYSTFAALLLLCIATIALCKADSVRPSSYREFLFTGKTFFHSLVSSAGAVFSVTYLLGATIIYATIYRAWTFIMAIAVATAAPLVINRIITLAARESSGTVGNSRKHNILISFMKRRLTVPNLDIFLRLLALAFFLLLVEELAIARLVLNSLLPDIALLPSLLLFVIVTVIFSYLSIGGFRALLNSDLVQGIVLVAFLLMLLFFVSDSKVSVIELAKASAVDGPDLLWASLFWTIYGASFLIMAVDLFARLNFEVPAQIAVKMKKAFIWLSLVLLFVIISIGILFGLALSPSLGSFQTASDYYLSLVSLFAQSGAIQVKVVFLVALFCMIFTTSDTLLLAVLQICYYKSGLGSRREHLSTILVAAVAASVLVDVDAVCAFGILVGSILILPCAQVLSELFPAFFRGLPRRHSYLWFALALSVITFLSFYAALEQNFTHHYLIPAIVVQSLLVSMTLWSLYEKVVTR